MTHYFGPTFDHRGQSRSAATGLGRVPLEPGISVIDSTAANDQLTATDVQVTDGDLTAGGWKRTALTRYMLIVG